MDDDLSEHSIDLEEENPLLARAQQALSKQLKATLERIK